MFLLETFVDEYKLFVSVAAGCADAEAGGEAGAGAGAGAGAEVDAAADGEAGAEAGADADGEAGASPDVVVVLVVVLFEEPKAASSPFLFSAKTEPEYRLLLKNVDKVKQDKKVIENCFLAFKLWNLVFCWSVVSFFDRLKLLKFI